MLSSHMSTNMRFYQPRKLPSPSKRSLLKKGQTNASGFIQGQIAEVNQIIK